MQRSATQNGIMITSDSSCSQHKGEWSVPHWFERMARLQGEHEALAAPDRQDTLTYKQLFTRIETFVNSLNEIGIGRGDRVCIIPRGGPNSVIGILGLASAAVAVPLNPMLKEQEIESLFDIVGPKALAVDAGAACLTASIVARARSIPVIEWNPDGCVRMRDRRADLAQPNCTGFAHLSETALLLFTSGTTAEPKLVPLRHANLAVSAKAIARSLDLTPNDCCLNPMPLFHIHGLVGGLLATLVSGGRVVCPARFQPETFIESAEDNRSTWYTAVPSMHRAVLAHLQNQRHIGRLRHLRFIRSCSAPLTGSVIAELESVFGVPVIEAYGMTEAAHQITSNPLPPLVRKPGSVGRPTGTQVAVLSQAGDFLPSGMTGEVVLRGLNVIDGYIGADDNRSAFLGSWFRTGDVGYLDDDGYLFLTGRLKEVINRGGEKISPLEIDKTLAEHPNVLEAVSFPVDHPSLGEDLIAAVVVRNKDEISEDALRSFLLKRLAQYKVPTRILIVDEIPRTNTGKAQRKKLEEVFGGKLIGVNIPPKDVVEEAVSRIYAEVLSVNQVGANENFFSLGGDSLRASQVISRIKAKFEIDFTVATLFQHPTVSELAGEIRIMMRSLSGSQRGAQK